MANRLLTGGRLGSPRWMQELCVVRRSPLAIAVAALVVLAPVGAIVHTTAPDELASLTVEDGAIEYVQALCYLVGAVAFGWVAWKLRRRSPWAGLLALGMFLVAGEEISWGQRIFGISTPDSLEASNVQGEINLHNLEGVHGSVRAAGMLLIVLLFVLLPLAHRYLPVARSFLDRLRTPIVPVAAVPLALVAMAYMVVPRVIDGVVFELDEVGELYLALAALTYGLGTAARIAPPATPVIDLTVAPTPAVAAASPTSPVAALPQ